MYNTQTVIILYIGKQVRWI